MFQGDEEKDIGLNAAEKIKEIVKFEINPVIDHAIDQLAKTLGYNGSANGLRGVVGSELNPVVDHAADKWKGVLQAAASDVGANAGQKIANAIDLVLASAEQRVPILMKKAIDDTADKVTAVLCGNAATFAVRNLGSAVPSVVVSGSSATTGGGAMEHGVGTSVEISGAEPNVGELLQRPGLVDFVVGRVEQSVKGAGVEAVRATVDHLFVKLTEVADRVQSRPIAAAIHTPDTVSVRAAVDVAAKPIQAQVNVGLPKEPIQADVKLNLPSAIEAEIKLFKVIPLLSIRARSVKTAP